MEHGRLPWPKPRELDERQRDAYDKIVDGPRSSGPAAFQLTDPDGRLEGPFNAMLVNPVVGDALQELGAAIRHRSGLTDREREIAILAVATVRRCEFEWYAHERIGALAGLTDDEIAALDEGRQAPTFGPSETMVHDVVRRLLDHRDLDDASYTAAERRLGHAKLSDLVTLVGYCDLLALSLRTWRTPLPVGEPPHFTDV